MGHRQRFDLERQCRDILKERHGSSCVVQVLKQFSFKKGSDSNEIFGEGPMVMNLSGFRYGIVMPCATGDLGEIVCREGISSSCLQQTVKQIGVTLLALHEQGMCV
jgi:hypothetical protein